MVRLFFQHAGTKEGSRHFTQSLARRRTVEELQPYFEKDLGPDGGRRLLNALDSRFPAGFNCWGIPVGGGMVFDRLDVGDIVLFIGKVQLVPYPDGNFEYAGRVKLKWPDPLHWTSQYIWDEARWPYMFFFDAVDISLPWPRFLDDVGYSETLNPRGWFQPVHPNRYRQLPGGSPEAYLQHVVRHHP